MRLSIRRAKTMLLQMRYHISLVENYVLWHYWLFPLIWWMKFVILGLLIPRFQELSQICRLIRHPILLIRGNIICFFKKGNWLLAMKRFFVINCWLYIMHLQFLVTLVCMVLYTICNHCSIGKVWGRMSMNLYDLVLFVKPINLIWLLPQGFYNPCPFHSKFGQMCL